MDTGELLQLVAAKLGEQGAFYPPDEVVVNGLNPAQRLLCLAVPGLLRARFVVTVSTDNPFIDLRTLTDGNRIRRVTRVVLGDVSLDLGQAAQTGELLHLRTVTLDKLASTRDWLSHKGEVRHFWQWGQTWLGVYKRPLADTTMTIIGEVTPTPLVLDAPTQTPDISAVYHPLIAEVATGLLLVKEGVPQGARGLKRVQETLTGLAPRVAPVAQEVA